MALYAQHGHGKADKITDALNAGTVQGVIFGARNEKPENLAAYLARLSEQYACELLLDPQFYVSTLVPPHDRFLPEYPYYEAGRTANDFTTRKIREYVRTTIDFQLDLGVTAIVSPSVIFESFSDRWYQIALNLADASLEHHASLNQAPPMLLSFIFAEEALGAEEELGRFLDTVTQDGWDAGGFYFVVARREGSYSQQFDSAHLANLLYLVHVLGEVNSLRVVCGYTDFVGITLRAAGAAAFATGWHQSLRQFHRKNFVERPPGGQPARERYSSGPLFNSVFISELEDIHDVGRLTDVLSRVDLDQVITSAPSPLRAAWNQAVSQQHHWQTLHGLDAQLVGGAREAMRHTLRRVREAQGCYALLERSGLTFERFTGKEHLAEWSRAISDFARRAGLTSA
jgi:hypothetical protein